MFMKTQKAPKYNIMKGGTGAPRSGNMMMVEQGNGQKQQKSSDGEKATEGKQKRGKGNEA